MGFYERYLLPKLLNAAMKSPDMTEIRRRLVPQASGRVIEIGIGSGLNLPFYGDDATVFGVDPSLELQAYAREVASRHDREVEFCGLSGETLEAQDNTFDSAVVTWTFCTIPQPERAIAELRRVLKPGGTLYFAEHGIAPDAEVVKWQNRINPYWRKLAGGCNLNRDPRALLADGGFNLKDIEADYIRGPRWRPSPAGELPAPPNEPGSLRVCQRRPVDRR